MDKSRFNKIIQKLSIIITILIVIPMILFVDNRIDKESAPIYECSNRKNGFNVLLVVASSIYIAILIIVQITVRLCIRGTKQELCEVYAFFGILPLIVLNILSTINGSMYIYEGFTPISNNINNFEEVYANVSGIWVDTIKIDDYCMKVYYYRNTYFYGIGNYISIVLIHIIIGVFTSILLVKENTPRSNKCISFTWVLVQFMNFLFLLCTSALILTSANYTYQECHLNAGVYYLMGFITTMINVILSYVTTSDAPNEYNYTFKGFYVFNVIKSVIAGLILLSRGVKCINTISNNYFLWYYIVDNTWILLFTVYVLWEPVKNWLTKMFVRPNDRPEEIVL
jgi:hypothetical protein